jgi:2-polyprenyl-3-methyl-5-hydroxy-6-metoxy-1,4-benzoquinol methylase
MLERTECDICGNDAFRLFERYTRWPGLEIVRCLKCGHVFTKQIMDDREYDLFYQDYHRKVAAYDKDYDFHDKAKYRQKITVFKQILGAVGKHSAAGGGRRLLDVGCYLGSFLDYARTRGFETWGCELDGNYVAYVAAKGHQCHHGTVDQLAFPDGFFDVIVLQEVFEHVPYPARMLDDLRRLLTPGGLLIIEVPNLYFHYVKGKIEKSVLKKLLGRPEVGLAPHHHLNHYTVKTLSRLMSRKGLAVVGVEMRKARAMAERHAVVMENTLYLWNHLADFLYKACRISLGNAIVLTARKE